MPRAGTRERPSGERPVVVRPVRAGVNGGRPRRLRAPETAGAAALLRGVPAADGGAGAAPRLVGPLRRARDSHRLIVRRDGTRRAGPRRLVVNRGGYASVGRQ